jgi:hypothetical protein
MAILHEYALELRKIPFAKITGAFNQEKAQPDPKPRLPPGSSQITKLRQYGSNSGI